MVVERMNWKTLLILHKENLRSERVKFGRDMETRLPLWEFLMEGKTENITNTGLLNLCWTMHPFEKLMKIKGSLYRKKQYAYTHTQKSVYNFRDSPYRCPKDPEIQGVIGEHVG